MINLAKRNMQREANSREVMGGFVTTRNTYKQKYIALSHAHLAGVYIQ